MFAGIYRDFAGESECGDCMYTRNTCNFWSKSKKRVDFLFILFIKIFQISL